MTPCSACGGERRRDSLGRPWCPPCCARRSREYRERRKANGIAARDPLPHTPAAWARRLERDPELYARVVREVGTAPREPQPVGEWRPTDAEFGEPDRMPCRILDPLMSREDRWAS